MLFNSPCNNFHHTKIIHKAEKENVWDAWGKVFSKCSKYVYNKKQDSHQHSLGRSLIKNRRVKMTVGRVGYLVIHGAHLVLPGISTVSFSEKYASLWHTICYFEAYFHWKTLCVYVSTFYQESAIFLWWFPWGLLWGIYMKNT